MACMRQVERDYTSLRGFDLSSDDIRSFLGTCIALADDGLSMLDAGQSTAEQVEGFRRKLQWTKTKV